jgi:hypothetical protein
LARLSLEGEVIWANPQIRMIKDAVALNDSTLLVVPTCVIRPYRMYSDVLNVDMRTGAIRGRFGPTFGRVDAMAVSPDQTVYVADRGLFQVGLFPFAFD